MIEIAVAAAAPSDESGHARQQRLAPHERRRAGVPFAPSAVASGKVRRRSRNPRPSTSPEAAAARTRAKASSTRGEPGQLDGGEVRADDLAAGAAMSVTWRRCPTRGANPRRPRSRGLVPSVCTRNEPTASLPVAARDVGGVGDEEGVASARWGTRWRPRRSETAPCGTAWCGRPGAAGGAGRRGGAGSRVTVSARHEDGVGSGCASCAISCPRTAALRTRRPAACLRRRSSPGRTP